MSANEENTTELISLYLQGSLSGETLEEFNRKLINNSAFRNEVELQRLVFKNISIQGRRELKLQLKEYHKQLISETKVPNSETQQSNISKVTGKKKIAWLAAASVFVALTTAGAFYYHHLSAELLYQEQFIQYTFRPKREAPSSLNDIVSFYKQGNYDAYLSHYLTKKERTLQEIFLAGNVFLIKGKPKQAIESFSQVIDKNNKLSLNNQLYYEDAEYYLALAYLKNNELDRAESLLKKIANSPDHTYHHNIKKLFLLKMKLIRLKTS